jgi:phage replication O-like protein O
MRSDLTGLELRICQAVARNTWGWNRTAWPVGARKLGELLGGMTRQRTNEGIRNLIKFKVLKSRTQGAGRRRSLYLNADVTKWKVIRRKPARSKAHVSPQVQTTSTDGRKPATQDGQTCQEYVAGSSLNPNGPKAVTPTLKTDPLKTKRTLIGERSTNALKTSSQLLDELLSG